MSNLKRITCYIFALLLFMQFFSIFSPTKAEATGPNPGDRYQMTYDKATKKITFRDTAVSQTLTFSFAPDQTQPTTQSISRIFMTSGIDGTMSDDAFLRFNLDSFPEISMLVNIRTNECMGLWKKHGTDDGASAPHYYSLGAHHDSAVVKMYEGWTAYNASMALAQLREVQNELNWSVENKAIVEKFNGYHTGTISLAGTAHIWHRDNIVFQTKVYNLFNADEKITQDAIMCGKASLNLSGSTFYDQLSADKKKKLTDVAIDASAKTFLWPKVNIDNLYNIKFYLLYNFEGSWVRATFLNTGGTWYIERRKDQVKLKAGKESEGIFEINLKGMPRGKYKLTALFYIKSEPNDADGARFDVPGDGGWWDLGEAIRRDKNNREQFQIDPFEIDLSSATPNLAQPGMPPACNNSTFKYRNTGSYDGALSESDDGKTVCDGLKGGFIVVMLKQAFCGLLLVTKQWADTAYNASMQLLATSIGVATDVTSVPTTDSADTIDVGPNSASDKTATTGDPGGGGNTPTDGDSSGDAETGVSDVQTRISGAFGPSVNTTAYATKYTVLKTKYSDSATRSQVSAKMGKLKETAGGNGADVDGPYTDATINIYSWDDTGHRFRAKFTTTVRLVGAPLVMPYGIGVKIVVGADSFLFYVSPADILNGKTDGAYLSY